jgi:hypothetical protein
MTTQKDAQDVTDQHIPLREEVERELRVRAWKDEAFRQELIANPKGVIERLFPQCFPDGKVPDSVTYKVIVEDPYTHHIILPALPDEVNSQITKERQEELIAHMGCSDYTFTNATCSCSCRCLTRVCITLYCR